MEKELLSIGRLAALSGLTVSALRFYDTADVLVPAAVDPSSGYRFYGPGQVADARLIARLRRISLPVNDIRRVLAAPEEGRTILAAHLNRLEAGLADARREISIVTHQLERPETRMSTFTLPATALIRALAEVRYAVSDDPELPMLHGVFLESDAATIRLVATDRFRLATSTAANPDQAELSLLLPTATVDELLMWEPAGELSVTVTDDEITLSGSGHFLRASLTDPQFPQYRPLLELDRVEVAFDAAALRQALAAGTVETRDHQGRPYELSRISVTPAGVEVGESSDPGATVIGVNREFLLQALDSGDQLTLGLDGPIAPLAIRNPDRADAFSILMPVRLDQPA